MKLKEAFDKAVKDWNPALAARIVDMLWHKHRCTYQDIYAMAERACGVDEATWEALLYEADRRGL